MVARHTVMTSNSINKRSQVRSGRVYRITSAVDVELAALKLNHRLTALSEFHGYVKTPTERGPYSADSRQPDVEVTHYQDIVLL
jgi:hypothetical protein